MTSMRGQASGRRLCACGLLALLLAGCGPPRTRYPDSLCSERPDERIIAIRHAADINDRSALGLLVDRLEDDDEAVRFYAIYALEKMTNTRMGYRYQASEVERARAVSRWRRFLQTEFGGGAPAGNEEPGP